MKPLRVATMIAAHREAMGLTECARGVPGGGGDFAAMTETSTMFAFSGWRVLISVEKLDRGALPPILT